MKIGMYDVSLLEAGDFRLDGGAMFGVVPKVLWNRSCPADDLNRIRMTVHCLLIESAERKILVDAGIGHKEKDSFNEIYAVDYSRNTLETSLKSRGLSGDDITDVICTHLHFDHCGGLTRIHNGTVEPMFPKARHFLQKRHWHYAHNSTERDRASFFPHNYDPLREADLLELIEGDGPIHDGVEVIVLDGHTPGMQTVKVSDGRRTVWFASDLLPMSPHVPLPYIMSYDLYPMTTLDEKKRLLPQAVEEEWVVVFQHDPFLAASRVVRNEKGHFAAGESVAL